MSEVTLPTVRQVTVWRSNGYGFVSHNDQIDAIVSGSVFGADPRKCYKGRFLKITEFGDLDCAPRVTKAELIMNDGILLSHDDPRFTWFHQWARGGNIEVLQVIHCGDSTFYEINAEIGTIEDAWERHCAHATLG